MSDFGSSKSLKDRSHGTKRSSKKYHDLSNPNDPTLDSSRDHAESRSPLTQLASSHFPVHWAFPSNVLTVQGQGTAKEKYTERKPSNSKSQTNRKLGAVYLNSTQRTDSVTSVSGSVAPSLVSPHVKPKQKTDLEARRCQSAKADARSGGQPRNEKNERGYIRYVKEGKRRVKFLYGARHSHSKWLI
jgi:hypothetical protein